MERSFRYRPKWSTIIYCIVFFGTCALVGGVKAVENDRGLIVNDIGELSPGSAISYWVLTAIGLGFVAISIFLIAMRLMLRQRVAYNDTELIIPRARRLSKEIRIPFQEIKSVSTSSVFGQHFLNVTHGAGKFTVTASMLPRKEDFDEICRVVAERAVNAPSFW